jgi:membrane protease YdiL (CAAX protease family)
LLYKNFMISINLLFTSIYVLSILFFFTVFLVIWLKHCQQLQPYLLYGLLAGFTNVILQFADILFSLGDPSLLELSVLLEPSVILNISISFLKMVIFTIIGMDYATKLRYPSFPIFSRILSGTDKIEENLPKQSLFLIHTLAVTTFSILYSIILFKLTNPEIGESLRLLLNNEPISQAQVLSPHSFLLSLTFAFVEEIVFRLGIQNFLAKHLNWRHTRYWLAITVTSMLWTMGHTGSLDPDWVKFAQVFPLGLLLGWLFRKHGVESCILAHGLSNIILQPLVLQLVRVSVVGTYWNFI